MTMYVSRPVLQPRRQSLGEELVNAITHGAGALLGIAGLCILVLRAVRYGTALNVVSVSIFGAAMILLYLVSCLYHALPHCKGKRVLQVLDHCSIFLLIVGSYAPVCLVTVGGRKGWIIFIVNGACGLLGILLNAISFQRWKKVSLALYVVMGWMGILILPTIIRELTPLGFALLLLGGVAYTAGIYFYRQKEKKYYHGIWHVFVLLGTVLQFFTVYTNCCY